MDSYFSTITTTNPIPSTTPVFSNIALISDIFEGQYFQVMLCTKSSHSKLSSYLYALIGHSLTRRVNNPKLTRPLYPTGRETGVEIPRCGPSEDSIEAANRRSIARDRTIRFATRNKTSDTIIRLSCPVESLFTLDEVSRLHCYLTLLVILAMDLADRDTRRLGESESFIRNTF